eukprot:506508_1
MGNQNKPQKASTESKETDKNKATSKPATRNKTDNKSISQQQNHQVKKGSFNPGLIISKGVTSKKELPKVEQLGEITLETLNKYDSNNSDRRLLSLFGTVFDVTAKIEKYGPEGSYKEFAGHDITLALGAGKLDSKWLDTFVQMSDKQIDSAQGWVEFYETQYPVCGTLKKWKEDQSKWPKLSKEEQEELDAECIIM